MLASALVTVIVAFPAVVPDFTATVFPLTLAVAILLLFEETLNVPVFSLTVNAVLFGYVIVPLVSDNFNFPSALFTTAVLVTVSVLYPILLAFTITETDVAFIICGIFSIYVFPLSIEYSTFESLGNTFTLVNISCGCPSYVPTYGTTSNVNVWLSALTSSTSISYPFFFTIKVLSFFLVTPSILDGTLDVKNSSNVSSFFVSLCSSTN